MLLLHSAQAHLVFVMVFVNQKQHFHKCMKHLIFIQSTVKILVVSHRHKLFISCELPALAFASANTCDAFGFARCRRICHLSHGTGALSCLSLHTWHCPTPAGAPWRALSKYCPKKLSSISTLQASSLQSSPNSSVTR